MDSLVRLLLRLILVPLGYLAAVTAGAAVILIGEWRIGTLFDTPRPDEAVLGLVIAVVAAGALMALLVSAMWLVAAVGILFSELFAVRSWIFHVANGAISAWIGAQMFGSDAEVNRVVHDPFYVIAAGLAGGLVYWLVAGSTAGFFKPVLRSPAERAARLRPPQGADLPPPGAT
ncbi:hypothetical protein [Xanthobacter variabilis]|uniref:hypothetical protein n=1 Tax=Xanthobacter variabilis TaxID=3119932 RepID=UPI00372AF45E